MAGVLTLPGRAINKDAKLVNSVKQIPCLSYSQAAYRPEWITKGRLWFILRE